MTRFELATPRPPDVCATGLRYIPKTVGKSNGKTQDFKKGLDFLLNSFLSAKHHNTSEYLFLKPNCNFKLS